MNINNSVNPAGGDDDFIRKMFDASNNEFPEEIEENSVAKPIPEALDRGELQNLHFSPTNLLGRKVDQILSQAELGMESLDQIKTLVPASVSASNNLKLTDNQRDIIREEFFNDGVNTQDKIKAAFRLINFDKAFVKDELIKEFSNDPQPSFGNFKDKYQTFRFLRASDALNEVEVKDLAKNILDTYKPMELIDQGLGMVDIDSRFFTDLLHDKILTKDILNGEISDHSQLVTVLLDIAEDAEEAEKGQSLIEDLFFTDGPHQSDMNDLMVTVVALGQLEYDIDPNSYDADLKESSQEKWRHLLTYNVASSFLQKMS